MLSKKHDFRQKISALSSAMDKVGLRKVARAIDVLVGSRSPTEHRKWDEGERRPAAQATIESLESQADKEEELTPEARETLGNLPVIKEVIRGVNEKDEELAPVEETGGLRSAKDQVCSTQPADVLWSLVRLRGDESILRAFLSRRERLGIRDSQDWKAFMKRHIHPLWRAFRDAFGEAYSNILWMLAAKGSKLYGCEIEKLLPEDVYTRAFQFYTDCGVAQSVTFSTSSGLPNPLERHGTAWFLDRYKVDRESDPVQDLLLKNPFRTDNFSVGILNEQIPCDRLYVWERERTSRALRKAYDAVPADKKDLFFSDSVERLAECLSFPRLRILEIPSFQTWMRRLTRNGPNSIMVSFRGPVSRRISHAVNINFSSAERIDRIYKLVLPAGLAVSEALRPSVALGIFWAVAIGLESYVYEELKKKVFTRGFDWRGSKTEGLTEVKPFGALPKRKAIRIAESKIQQMLGSR